ncbi:MAG: DUF4349 domain-containing protein [Bacteroidota bacterium]
MNQGPDEQMNTPLEEALLNLPQEEPPADLQGACMAALHEASMESRPHRSWEPWRQLVAAAAVLVMIVGTGNLLLPGKVREKVRYVPPTEFNNFAGRVEAPMAPSAPAGPAPVPTVVAERPSSASPQPVGRMSLPKLDPLLDSNMDRTRSRLRSLSPQAARPWDEQSDTRRKITERTVELETPQVEETYKQAVVVIEKAGGYVLQENLMVRRRGHSQAQLQARIPVAQFDGVISQVRELGRLVLMTGQTQDATEQYQSGAADVRGLGAREEKLADRYSGEKDERKRAQLGLELKGVRQQLETAKQSLKSLSKDTDYARLALTINESRGLRAIVRSSAEAALPLVFSLSLIAVPLLVLALIWKRRG